MGGFIWVALVSGWTGLAHAQTHVIHTGEDSRMVVARAAAASKTKAEDLKAFAPLELSVGKPALLEGPGRAETCNGIRSAESAVGSALVRAERAMAYLEFDKAQAHLQVGENALGCLSEIVIPDRAARIHYLRGVLNFAEFDEPAARTSFEHAVAYRPDLPWDDNFPPDSQDLLTEARKKAAEQTAIPIQLVPAPPDGSVWIDGNRVQAPDGTFSLTPGPHLVQIAAEQLVTLRVRMRVAKAEATPEGDAEAPGIATLVVPQILPANAASWAFDEAKRPVLDQVLGAIYDPHTEVLFTADGAVARHVVGTEDWEALKVPAGFASVGGVPPRIAVGRATMWSGIAVFSGGAILATSSWLKGKTAVREYKDATQYVQGHAAQDKYKEASQVMGVARWVTFSGVVLAGGGAAMTFLDAPLPFQVAPMGLPGGGGIRIGFGTAGP